MHKYYSERLARGKNNKITHALRKFRIAGIGSRGRLAR